MMFQKALNQSLQRIKILFQKQKICGLRQAIQQIRDNDESFQYELFKVAQAKGYYTPSAEASQQEIDNVKNEFNN